MALRKVGGTNRNNFESAALVCTTIIFGLPSSVSDDDDVSIDMTTAHCQSFIDLYSGFFNINVAFWIFFENTLAPNLWQGMSKEAA